MSDIQTLEAKASELRKELAEVEAAIEVFRRYTAPSQNQAEGPIRVAVNPSSIFDHYSPCSVARSGLSLPLEPAMPSSGGSLKEQLVEILKESPIGLTKKQIREELSRRFVGFNENTLTWNLTMKKDLFKSDNGRWFLKS